MRRWWWQTASVFISNSYLLSQSFTKGICVPILNCHACPAAIFTCPIGVLQYFAIKRMLPLYVLGIMGVTGSVFGMMSCGWICPFGFFQDLLYKIKTPKIGFPREFGYIKYLILIGLVLVVPYLVGSPWFCRLCPQGLLEGSLSLLAVRIEWEMVIQTVFLAKTIGLFGLLVLSAISKRPFCQYLCPLGAVLSLFNRISLYRLRVDVDRCTGCKRCERVCPVGLRAPDGYNSISCIRCLDCTKACSAVRLSTW
jgi:polyferredoxin